MMRAIELFAGAGGLGLGVSRAGFKPEAVIEWDRYCADTLRENQFFGHDLVRDWPVHHLDVRQFDYGTVPAGLDLVTGGPPCQPFSIGGKHKGPLDARDMWPQAVRAIRETAPRAFIFENVKGLTRASFANYFAYIQLQLRYPELGASNGEDWQDHLQRLERYHTLGKERGLYYRLVARVLNAADYGVPQKRERVVIVGFRSDLNIEWSFPPPTHSLDALIWSQFRDGDYWERHGVLRRDRIEAARWQSRAKRMDEKPTLKPWLTVRDALGDLPDPQSAAAAAVPNHRFQGGARVYPGHTGSPIDEAAKTLKAGAHGVPGGENMLALPDGRVRYFTVRESARLQTFPDDFAFHGSWTETMRQLGNAVPVMLACVVASSVRQQLAAVDSGDGLQPSRQEESGSQCRRSAAFH